MLNHEQQEYISKEIDIRIKRLTQASPDPSNIGPMWMASGAALVHCFVAKYPGVSMASLQEFLLSFQEGR